MVLGSVFHFLTSDDALSIMDLYRVAATTVIGATVLFTIFVYFRYFFLSKRYGIKIGHIGWGFVHRVRNNAKEKDSSTMKQPFQFHIGLIELFWMRRNRRKYENSGSRRSITTDHPVQSPRRWIHLYIRDAFINIDAPKQTYDDVKRLATANKSTAMASHTLDLILHHLGLAVYNPEKWSLIDTLTSPVATLLRRIVILIITRLVTITAENARIRLTMEEKDAVVEWKCERLTIDAGTLVTPITGDEEDEHNKQKQVKIQKKKEIALSWISKFILSPKTAITEMFMRRPSRYRMTIACILSQFSLSCSPLKEKMDFKIPLEKSSEDVVLLQTGAQLDLVLSFRLASFTSHLMFPRADVIVDTMNTYADAISELALDFKKTAKEQIDEAEPISNVEKAPALDLPNAIKIFLFSNWKVGISLVNFKIIYGMDAKRSRQMAHTLFDAQDAQSRTSSNAIFPTNEALKVSVKWDQVIVKVGSRRVSWRPVYDPNAPEHQDRGEFSVSCDIDSFHVNLAPNHLTTTVYEELGLFKFRSLSCSFSVPHGSVPLLAEMPVDDKLYPKTKFNMCDGILILDQPHLMVDHWFLTRLAQVMLGTHEDKQPQTSSSPNQPIYGNHLIQKILSNLSHSIKVTIQKPYFGLLLRHEASYAEQTTKFLVAMVHFEQLNLDLSWDQEQNRNMQRRKSLRDSLQNMVHYYSSAQVQLIGLRASIVDASYGESLLLLRCSDSILPTKSFIILPEATILLNCTTPGAALAVQYDASASAKWISPVENAIEVFIDTQLLSNGLRAIISAETGFTQRTVSVIHQTFASNILAMAKKVDNEASSTDNEKTALPLGPFLVNASARVNISDWIAAIGVYGYGSRLLGVVLQQFSVTHRCLLDSCGVYAENDMARCCETMASIDVDVATWQQLPSEMNQKKNTILSVKNIEITQLAERPDGLRDLWRVTTKIDAINITYALFVHLLVWRAGNFVLRLAEPFTSMLGISEVTKKKKEMKPFPLIAHCKINQICLKLNLPNDVNLAVQVVRPVLEFDLEKLDFSSSLEQIILKVDEDCEMIRLLGLKFQLPLSIEQQDGEVSAEIQKVTWFLPYEYDFAKFIDNITNFVKSVKQLHQRGFTVAQEPYYSKIDDIRASQFQKLPTIRARILEVSIMFADHPFDGILSRNTNLALEEQRNRLHREKAFERKISKMLADGETWLSDKKRERAWQLLMEANSKFWIQKVQDKKYAEQLAAIDGRLQKAPLFFVQAHDIDVKISKPTLLAPTIEETIHILDPLTPKDLFYDVLAALDVELSVQDLLIRIRDFPTPLLYVPRAPEATKVKGTVIINEFVRNLAESSRHIVMPIRDIFNPSEELELVAIFRTIAPTKIHTSIDINIHGAGKSSLFRCREPARLAQFCYGIALEPHLADLNRRFSALTPNSADPSDSLPFWDKIRLLAHGNIRLRVEPTTGFRVRLTGSRRAHDDGTGKSAGLDIVLSGGIQAKVGHDYRQKKIQERRNAKLHIPGNQSDEPPIRVECRQVHVAIPNGYGGEENLGFESDIIARLSGGLQLGIKLDFETKGSGDHSDVVMRTPEAAAKLRAEHYDSFAPIRSKSIVLNLSATAPNPHHSDQGKTYVRMHHEAVNHFIRFAETYTSPLTVLPIRRGVIFYPPPLQAPKNQKLSRYIRGINIYCSLENLLLGYSHATEVYEIGARARIQSIQLALFLQQQNFSSGKKGTGWDLLAADYDMENLEVQTVSSGDFHDGKANESQESVSIDGPLTLEEDEEERQLMMAGWTLDMDGDDDIDMEDERFQHVLWAPRVVYFRQGSEKVFESSFIRTQEDSILPQRDINAMQLQLLYKRLNEIEMEIDKDKDRLKYWEDRISMFEDDVLRTRSQALVERIATLYEKKTIIQKSISNMSSKVKSGRVPEFASTKHRRSASSIGHMRKLSAATIDIKSFARQKEFLHRFVVHNLKVVWNIPIRNLIFKFIELEQQNQAIQYYMKTTAVRILRQMVESTNNQTNPSTKQSSAHASQEELNIDQQDEKTLSKTIAQQLLQKLITERDENFIVHDDSNDDTPISNEAATKDPSHPLYVSPAYRIHNEIQIQLFYPQFSLQTTAQGRDDGYVIIAAETAGMKRLSVFDDGDNGTETQLVKHRYMTRIENAQFFTAFRENAFEKLLERGEATSIGDVMSPLWVPLECLIDRNALTDEFRRFVDRTTLVVQYDHCSAIYLPPNRRTKRDVLFADKPGLFNDSSNDLEHVNSVFVNFPNLVISATSQQFCAVNDIIGNLLVYNDPGRKQRMERVNTMMFALLKEDLNGLVDVVLDIQAKLRRLLGLADKSLAKMSGDWNDASSDVEEKNMEIVRKKQLAAQELLMVMDAMKRIASQRQYRDSVKKNLRCVIDSKNVSWSLLSSPNQNLCQLTLVRPSFNLINYEDQSNVNTVEIDKILLQNCLERQMYRELIAPYVSDETRELDFSRQKMLRVYWRELAPVAGIAMIDHFEVNIHPLLFQLTYEVAKGLIEYLYPKKNDLSSRSRPPSSRRTRKGQEDPEILPGPLTLRRARGATVRSLDPSAKSTSEQQIRYRSTSNPVDLRGTVPNEDDSLSSDSDDQKVGEESSDVDSRFMGDGLSLFGSMKSPSIRSKRRKLRRFLTGADGEELLRSLSLTDDDDVKMMKDRASANKTFVYIKIPGSTHCVSYHGEKEKNIADMYRFVIRLPTLEYHNRTWTWLEFLMQMRKDVVFSIVSQTGSFIREKLSRKRRHPPKALRLGYEEELDSDKKDSSKEASEEDEAKIQSKSHSSKKVHRKYRSEISAVTFASTEKLDAETSDSAHDISPPSEYVSNHLARNRGQMK